MQGESSTAWRCCSLGGLTPGSALSAGGCPSPTQLALQSSPQLEPPPHLGDPDHRLSIGVSCIQRPLPWRLPPSCKEIDCCCLPIPRASPTLTPCRVIPLVPAPHFKSWRPLLRPKAPHPALPCPHLDPCGRLCLPLGALFPTQRQSRQSTGGQGLGVGCPGPGWAGGPLRCGALPRQGCLRGGRHSVCPAGGSMGRPVARW